MDQKKLLEALSLAIKSPNDPLSQITLWLQVHLKSHQGEARERAYEEIVALASAIGGPVEMVDCWVSLWLAAPLGSVLSARAKGEILVLVDGSELMLHVYCQLPKKDPLKEDLRSRINAHSKTKGFSFEAWEIFFQTLKSGDKMKSYAVWQMSRTGKNDIDKSLKVYGYFFDLRDPEGKLESLEEKCIKSILSLAPTIRALICVYATAPEDSLLEKMAMKSIVEKLRDSKERLEAYPFVLRKSDLQKAIINNVQQVASKVEDTKQRLFFWLNISLKVPEGDDLREVADKEAIAICKSVGREYVDTLKKIVLNFKGSRLGGYAEAKLKELVAAK